MWDNNKNSWITKEEKMVKKILYCASTASHILNFHLPYLQYFKEKGWQVDVAVGGQAEIPYADNIIVLPFKKSLLSVGNLSAVYSVKKLLDNNRYDIISTHTALAGALVRMAACLNGKQQSKVVHTSHGYFFYEESNLYMNPYLWVERLLAPITDVLMVMNKTDHNLAKKYKLGKKIVHIPGMGIDLRKFSPVTEEEKKRLKVSAGFNPDDFLIVYAAEMSKRKNQGELIRAFAKVAAQEPRMKLLLAGDGALKDKYERMAQKYGLTERVLFLGYVKDMVSLYQMCDLAVSTSRSEGLPFNIMEAMACGIPVVASNIKGHNDLIKYNCLSNSGDERALSDMILLYFRDDTLRMRGQENIITVQSYGLNEVKPEIVKVYRR